MTLSLVLCANRRAVGDREARTPTTPPTRDDLGLADTGERARPIESGVIVAAKVSTKPARHPNESGRRSDGVSNTVAAQGALRSMAERQDLGHIAALYRKVTVPAVLAWFVWVPLDGLIAWGMYPGTFLRSLAVRFVCGLGMYASLRALSRATTYGAMTLGLVLLALFVNGGVGLVATWLGGVSSPYHPGSLVVIAVMGFSPLPWKRLVPIVLASWLAYPLVVLAGALLDPAQRAALHGLVAVVPLIAITATGLIVSVMACIGASLAWTLRQQVFESRSIGRYQLRRRLGAGGMGEVWAAWHRGLKREVALKVLRAPEGDAQAALRFEREVSAMTELAHPNTVRVFDYGVTDDGITYYAMELLRGENLVELVSREGALPAERAVYLVEQAARALAEAHARSMVHRDVKPENLFVTDAGGERDFVKVLDFGIVRRAADQGDASLTKTGAIAGTPAYIAPEVTRGEEPTAAVDVYALGAVLYFLVAGRAPFEGASAMALLLAHLTEPVTPLSALGVAVPADVEALVMRCLEKSPDARPADAMELATLLAQTSVAGKWKPARVASPESVRGPRVTTGTEPTVEVSRAV